MILMSMEEMDGEEDEDVIFEGSPLFEYLKETCPAEEFESSSLPKSPKGQQVTPAGRSKNRYAYLKMVLSRLGRLHIVQICKNVISWTSGLCQVNTNLKAPFELRTLSRISQSKLTNEADNTFLRSLERYLEDETHIQQPVPLAYIFISGILFLSTSICFLVSCMTLTVIRLSSTEQTPILSASTAWPEVFLGVVFLLVSLSIVLRGLHQWRVSHLFRHLSVESERCIRQEETFFKCFRRSLRYIQEVEVLSRGYTMVNVPSGNKETSVLQLLPLRKVCLLVITRRLTMLRAATSTLIDSYPVPPEYRLIADCITNQEIPDWINSTAINDETPESNNEEEILSLSTLKVLFGLYKEQCSDFYRQLVISLVYSDKLSCGGRTGLQELPKWLRILTNSTSECEESTNRLTQTYQLHRWSHAPGNTDKPREISRREVWKPEVQCITAVHSLRLHLETMLSRVSSVDDQLTDSEAISITEDRLTELQSLMAEIGDHMDASQICCQEARASLHKLACRDDPVKVIDGDKEGTTVAVKPLDQAERILITAEYSDEVDGDMDEEIFEAYIDAKRKLQEEEDSEEWLQERIQRRREAEDSKRMLQELNSVLNKRSKEKERNKQEKLRKQQTGQEDSSSAAVGGRGDCKYAISPTSDEYSLDEPVQGTQQNGKMMSGSTPEILRECVNTAGCGDDLNSRTLPPSNISNEYSKVTDEATEPRSLDIGICHNTYHDISSTSNVSSQSHCIKQASDTMSGNRQPIQGESFMSAGIFKEEDLAKRCESSSVAGSSEREPTYSGRSESVSLICTGEADFDIHSLKSSHESIQSIEDTKSIGVYTNEDSLPGKQEEISDDDESIPLCLYEGDSSCNQVNGLGESREVSESRSSFLAINPWMASGLAAQVAKISQERINLSEETFGEDDYCDG